MNIQTRASFKKELMAYIRTYNLLAVALVIIGLAIFSPLLIAGTGALMDAMSDVYDEMGIDVSIMTEMLGTAASIGVTSSVESITGAGLIVVLLLLNKAAGGEQKKRAVIIPKSAGLRSFAYIFPKFIIYPLSVFVITVAAMFAAWAFSLLVFDVNDVTFSGVLLSGIISGFCLMLYVCFHLALGTATGKAAMSAAVCITASILLPAFFSVMSAEYMFNPFALNVVAYTVILNDSITGAELTDIAVSAVFALGIMTVAYFVALFAQNARKVDNRGNEIDL